MTWRLIDDAGNELQPGVIVRTFRGEDVRLRGFIPPRRVGSSGKVVVETAGGHTLEYYPSVIGARIVEVG